jgi:ubiquinone/menaquinone biosynthesis C-methylase UbiE
MRTHRDILKPELERILLGMDLKGKNVLEIGQGQDTEIRTVLEGFGLNYFALDSFIGSNNDGWDRKDKGEYVLGSMEDMPLENDMFDLVVSIHSFEHSLNPIQALKEIKRVLKSDGHVIIVTPYPCKHHILDSDFDHYFVLTDLQMCRLLIVTEFKFFKSIMQRPLNEREQDWNIFTVGVK